MIAVLAILGAGLLLGSKRPVVVVAVIFLIVGLLVAGTGFGEFLRTLLTEAYSFFTT